MKRILLLFISILSLTLGFGQVTTIDFETAGSGYTSSATLGSGFTDVFNRANPGIGGNSSYLWAVEDVNNSSRYIDINQISITGATSFSLDIDMIAHHYNDWDANTYMHIEYSLDGGAFQPLLWVETIINGTNAPAALDTDFNGIGNCGATTTLPSLSTGTADGCTVASARNQFETFSSSSISLSGNSTLDIKLTFNDFSQTDQGIYLDNIVVTQIGGAPSFSVTFDANGGAGTMSNQTSSSAANLNANTFTRTGFSFSGWNTATDGSGTSYADAVNYSFSADVTLYAQWTALAPCATPSTQATSLSFANITASSMDVSFTATTADNYLVVQSTSATLSSDPVDATSYSVTDALGGGTVVYNGSGTSFTASGLSSSTQYYYFVFAYNDAACSGGPKYLTPALIDDETTIAGPCLSDDFNSGYGNWTGGSGTYTNSTAGNTGNGVGFNTNFDDIITSGALTNPASITFNARASGSTSNFTVRVQYSTTATGPWTDATTIVANGSNTGDITNSNQFFTLTLGLTGTYYLRIVQNPRSGGSFYLDDVDVFCGLISAPDIVLSSSNLAVAASSILEGSDDNVIYAFDLAVTTSDAIFTAFDFTTSGTAVNGNITNFKAYYSSDATFDVNTDTYLDNVTTAKGPGVHTISGFSQTILNGTTGYFFITTDLPCPSTVGNTIIVDAITTADLTFASGNKTGTAYASGTHSIINDTPVDVTGLTTSLCENEGTTVSWTAATGCFDNYIVVASLSSLTTAPSGDGISYTANSIFGSGTSYDDGFVVYKGTGTTVSVTGLTNGTDYTYTVFTRNGTTWSAGVEVNCTPTLTIPDNGCGSNELTQTVTYSGISTVDDINVFVSIEHVWRSDLNIEIESPAGTIVQLFDGSNSGSEDNLEVIFDDAGSAITNFTHTIDGTEDETVTSDVDLLSTFNGEASDGVWTLRVCDDASGDVGSFVSWSIDITEACTPTHSFASLFPTSGAEGTEVTITGTGMTSNTTASFGGVSAVVDSIDATTILVTVPAGAADGNITLTEEGCPLETSVFTLIGASGTCINSTGTFTDLIISEVYDSDANNVWYVELYNPTASPIDLAAGDYEIDRYADLTTTTVSSNADLTGTVPAYSTFLLSLGTSANTCSNTFDFNVSLSGINAEDRNVLTKGGVDIDAVEFPNQTGYTIKRLGSASGPTATYNAADWDLSLIEDCSDLGVAPVVTFANPTVSSIVDASDCSLFDYSVSVVEGDLSTTGDLTYQWYFNDGVTAGWTAVSSTLPAGLTVLGEDGNNLLIGEDVDGLNSISDYQFYCEVTEDGTCVNVSNTEKFEFTPEPYFRTKGAGLSKGSWNDVTLWEMSSDLMTWSSACTYPTASNSDTIIIQPLDSIAVVEGIASPVDITADQVYVASTAVLLIDESAEFNVDNNGVLADLVIDGILIDNANGGAGNGITFINGGTWELGANGVVIKSNSSSVNKYRDAYESGIANIPATAHWAYVNAGLGAITNGTLNMYYPNLYFESVTGNYDASAFTEVFGGSSSTATVKGDLSIGLGTISQGTGTYKLYNNNQNTQPILIMGDVYIGPGSEFTNVDIAGGASNGTGIEVKGSFAIDGTLDMTNGTGITKLSGTTKQDIVSFGTGVFNTYEFELDNSADAELDDIDVNITNTLTFTNGKIITDVTSADMVFVQNSSTSAISGGVAQSGTSKYVEGKLQWTTDGSSSYTFPIGEASNGAQGFTITPTGSGGENVLGFLNANSTNPLQSITYCDLETHPGGGTVNAGNGNAGYDGVLDQITFNVASPLQWNVTNPNSGITEYDITVLASGAQSIPSVVTSANGVDVRFLLKNGQAYNGSTSAGTSSGAPSFNTTGFSACPNQYSLSGMTSFSQFTLNGATQSSTTLPVELLYFQAENQDENVLVSWATVTEINNDFFTVERSDNGEDFVAIGKVEGAGNFAGKLEYQLVDKNPINGVSYYRLKQTDFDGSFEYSQIVVVDRKETEFILGELYPNPVTDELNLVLQANENEKISIQVYDMLGKNVLNYNSIMTSSNKLFSVNVQELSAGTYTLKIQSESKNISKLFVKK